jgi:hypothetical protein
LIKLKNQIMQKNQKILKNGVDVYAISLGFVFITKKKKQIQRIYKNDGNNKKKHIIKKNCYLKTRTIYFN